MWANKYGPIFRRYEKRPKIWKNPPPSVTVPFLNGQKRFHFEKISKKFDKNKIGNFISLRSMADMQPINDIYDSYHSNYR